VAGVIVPAATLGSSASALGSALSEQAASLVWFSPQEPPCAELSRTPCAVLPTLVKSNPPSTGPVGGEDTLGATPLAANTMSLECRPSLLVPCSYQTTHGTASLAPVNAMSGSTAARVRSTLSDGSAPSRSTPTCCQQKPPSGVADGSTAAGVTPMQLVCPGPRGFSTKIWSLVMPGALAPVSCQVTHGPGLVGSAAEPPATDGFSAS
jgi:hypothetical protein